MARLLVQCVTAAGTGVLTCGFASSAWSSTKLFFHLEHLSVLLIMPDMHDSFTGNLLPSPCSIWSNKAFKHERCSYD